MGKISQPPYIRLVDNSPHRETCYPVPQSLLLRDQIVNSYIPAGIKVSINSISTGGTFKVRLVFPVRLTYMSTFTTPLRSASWINIHNLYAFALSLILYKLLKLSKVPTMYPSSFLFGYLNPFSNSFKLFQYNSSTSRNKTNNLFGYFMVNSSPKLFLLLRQLLKMSFCRRSAFRLQFLSYSKVSFRYSPYMSSIKKFVNFSIGSRYNCKFRKPQINSYNGIIIRYFFKFFFNNYVKEKLFKPFIIFQRGRANLPVQILFKVFRNFDFELKSTFYCSNRYFFSIKPYRIRPFIISNSWIVGIRTGNFKTFLFPTKSRFETFGSYHSCRDNKLRWQRGFFSNGGISKIMEFYRVVDTRFPTYFSYKVIGKFVFFKSFKKDLFLFFRRFNNKLNSSFKFHSRNILTKNIIGLLPVLKNWVSDRWEVNYELIPILVKAIQELSQEIEKLKEANNGCCSCKT